MGLTGIIGMPEDDYLIKVGALEGTGKTMAMVDCIYRDIIHQHHIGNTTYKGVINIKSCAKHIPFCEYMSLKDMVLAYKNKKLDNASLGIDELPSNISSLGEDKMRLSFFGSLLNQGRKGKLRIYYTIQREKDTPPKVRERTNIKIVPEKYHKADGSICINPLCEDKHYIKLFLIKPAIKPTFMYSIDCDIVGKLYDHEERIDREELEEEDIVDFFNIDMREEDKAHGRVVA